MSTIPNSFSMTSDNDGLTIHAHHWVAPVETKAIVLIAHGLAEYGLRYDRFAQALAVNGYDTYAIDHRGHAKSVTEHEPLSFADTTAHPSMSSPHEHHSTGLFLPQQPSWPDAPPQEPIFDRQWRNPALQPR